MADQTSHTLEVPGATLTYDVRRADSSAEPMLLMIGSPMAAAGFVTLAGHFTDRTVVTYDPRGVERSTATDASAWPRADEHADDLHRLIKALGDGSVDLFASSGGAINALALVAAQPDDVRVLVAHEPPLVDLLPDRDAVRAASRAVYRTYMERGAGAGFAHFIAMTSHKGLFSDDWADQPAPDPAAFGMSGEDDGSRDDPLLGQDPDEETSYVPDFDAIGQASTRLVVAAGRESEGEITHRAAAEVAARLGTDLVIFPSHHGGFLGGEYGHTGEPDAFAAKLREVLHERVL
jgi:pimeloyl-ACP methyl ester carboxylesterase